MNKTDKIANTIFLIALAAALIFVIAGMIDGSSKAEASHEPTTLATVAETTEYITEPTQEETIATEATEPVETEPAVILYDVPLEEELQLHIISEAEAHGIDPAIIIAMAFRESTYRANAIGDGGNSLGLLQIQPRWHSGRMERLGCPNLLDPYQNVTVGVDYLCELLNRYGDIGKALTAYNRGHYAGTITDYAWAIMAKAESLQVM